MAVSIEELSNRVQKLEENAEKHLRTTEQIKEDTEMLVEFIRAIRVGGSFLVWIGKVCAWIGAVCVAILSVWAVIYQLRSGGKPIIP